MPVAYRDYQRGAIDSLRPYRDPKVPGHPLIISPTGSGKSLMIAGFVRETILDAPFSRFAIVTHVQELILQNHAALMSVWPDPALAGINCAGLGRRDTKQPVLFVSVQSVFPNPEALGRIDYLIIDEAHRLPRKGHAMYQQLITRLQAVNPDIRIVGFTATGYRLDSGLLIEGDDRLFTTVAFEIGMLELIKAGWLSPIVGKAAVTQFDIAGVSVRGGEYVQSELERAVDKEDITRAAATEIIRVGQDRHTWLNFCSGVDHSYHVRDAIRAHGISCETVVGSTPGDERAAIFAALKRGELRSVTGCNVFTTGFDAPNVDLIAMLRPTMSPELYVQMAGRGSRRAPNKTSCLLLDFASNVRRHGPIDQVTGTKRPSGKDGVVPMKVCPECLSYVNIAARECPDCGYVFPPPELKISPKADDAPVLSTQQQWLPVRGVSYRLHMKPGKPSSMRVDYRSGLISYSEWICFEHGDYPRQKAQAWWWHRGGNLPPPLTVAEALSRTGELRTHAILVGRDGQFDRILSARFAAQVAA